MAGAARGCWQSRRAGPFPTPPTTASILEPEGTFIGTVNEDFAIESLAGDIFQLGNLSWKILRVQQGTVRVEDAHGQPPGIPFWLGEAPARSDELSEAVSQLRGEVEAQLDGGLVGRLGPPRHGRVS